MDVYSYITNRADQFKSNDVKDYQKYFNAECNIALALVALGFVFPGAMIPPALALAADIGARGFRDKVRENPQSGLVGIAREHFQS